jgi:hypothetical protein
MPTVTVNRADVSRDEAMDAVRQQLDDRHTVTPRAGSPDVFTVKTSTMAEAKVHVKPADGATEFHVHGTGIIIGRIINELVIARRVAAAIASAPGLKGSD